MNKKLGYYTAGTREYKNKLEAISSLKENETLLWNFNNDVFMNYDFSIEPPEDLYELYKQRALQIRKKYDNVILYFSGGIDSISILRTFIDNNIKLDGVIMYGTWKLTKKYKYHPDVLEQDIVGLPYLRLMEKKHNINLNIRMLDTTDFYNEYTDESYVFKSNMHLMPRMYAHNFYWKDSWFQSIMMTGKTCSIRGIDKPRVVNIDGQWHVGFLDTNVVDAAVSGDIVFDFEIDTQEYFFWTPDYPAIITKQAHIVKNYLKTLELSEHAILTTHTHTFKRSLYYKHIDPLIYGKYLDQKPGEDKKYFSVGKAMTPTLLEKDKWFHNLDDPELLLSFANWKAGINYIQNNVDNKWFNSGNQFKPKDVEFNTWIHELSQEYNIQNINIPNDEDGHIIFGVLGTWSGFYPLETP